MRRSPRRSRSGRRSGGQGRRRRSACENEPSATKYQCVTRRDRTPYRVLRTYLPAIIFVLLGAGVGGAFAVLNTIAGPGRRKGIKSKADPYECGLPSEIQQGFRFG